MHRSAPNLRSFVDLDGAAILDIENGSIIRLNPTGGFIWQALQRGEEARDIIQRLCAEADVAPEVVSTEVQAFIGDLRRNGLLPC